MRIVFKKYIPVFSLALALIFLGLLELGFKLLTWSPHREQPYTLRTIPKLSKSEHEWMGLTENPKFHFDKEYENIEFLSRNDRVKLKGWAIRPIIIPSNQSCGIIFVHGRGTDRRTFLKHLNYISKTECSLFMYDNRNHGESGPKPPGTSLGMFEKNDVLGAIDFVNSLGIHKIHLLGTSLGGAASLLAAKEEPLVSKLIIENSFSSARKVLMDFKGPTVSTFRPLLSNTFIIDSLLSYSLFRLSLDNFIDPESIIADISPRPILLIHSIEDQEIPVNHSYELFEKALEPKFLWTPEKGNHSSVYNQNSKEYEDRVLSFLRN